MLTLDGAPSPFIRRLLHPRCVLRASFLLPFTTFFPTWTDPTPTPDLGFISKLHGDYVTFTIKYTHVPTVWPPRYVRLFWSWSWSWNLSWSWSWARKYPLGVFVCLLPSTRLALFLLVYPIRPHLFLTLPLDSYLGWTSDPNYHHRPFFVSHRVHPSRLLP